jgi:hypothetical protein
MEPPELVIGAPFLLHWRGYSDGLADYPSWRDGCPVYGRWGARGGVGIAAIANRV